MTTSVSYLSSVQQILTRYGMSTYVAFGNLGNLLTIAIFCQSDQRRNSCSLYLLAMTICNLVCLDVGIKDARGPPRDGAGRTGAAFLRSPLGPAGHGAK